MKIKLKHKRISLYLLISIIFSCMDLGCDTHHSTSGNSGDDDKINCISKSILRNQYYMGSKKNIFPAEAFFQFEVGRSADDAVKLFGKPAGETILKDGKTKRIIYFTDDGSLYPHINVYSWQLECNEKGTVIDKFVVEEGS